MRKILLAEKSSALYTIWVDKKASSTAHYAAGELAKFLSIMGDTTFNITSKKHIPENAIVIGDSNFKKVDKNFSEEGYTILTEDNRVYILGNEKRGILYGVYSFLEILGCRWFAPDCEHIPKKTRIEVSKLNITETPPLEYREVLFQTARDGNWSVRNKHTGTFVDTDNTRGGKVYYPNPFVHSFDFLLSVNEYFDTHPEYFSLVGGKRVKERTQLCLTNPDVYNIVLRKVEKWIEENPDGKIFSVSQNDCYNPCECDNCKKIDDEEGSYAGTMIYFVNKIAEVIGKKYPDVVIDTLAYQYTRPAPKTIKPLENVCVRLCTIECCFSHPLRDCDKICSFNDKIRGDSFQKDMEDWAKICNRLYIWDYVVNYSYYVMPFPNFYVLADNIKYFIENNVKGIFEEGAPTIYGNTEFAELRSYVVAKLLWNPNLDTDTLVEEFISGYYGMGAPHVQKYFKLIHEKAAENKETHFGIYDPPRINYLTEDVVKEGIDLFNTALSLSDNEIIYKRTRIASMPIWYWYIFKLPLEDKNRQGLIEEFFTELDLLGIHEIWEGRTRPEAKEQMEKGLVWRFEE